METTSTFWGSHLWTLKPDEVMAMSDWARTTEEKLDNLHECLESLGSRVDTMGECAARVDKN